MSGGTAYTVHGSGRPVVLVAGAGGTGRIWEHHQVPALTAAGHQVITFDHDTAGSRVGELAAAVRQLLTALELPPCPLVGHSLGAMAIQELLLTDPHLASGAVLAATRGRPDAVGDALARAEAAYAEAGSRLPPEYQAFVQLVQNLSPRTLADEGAVAEWLDLFEIAALSSTSVGAHRSRPPAPDRLAAYAGITTPLLVVGFADDVLAPAYLSREVAAAIPGARYTQLADTGHLGFLERPDAFNTVLLDFLATIPTTDTGASHVH
ncbi:MULTISPECIES: alpha/beta fold hydrolase [Streptomyces]|uniref:Alpha/beta hydrolase n=1 Tax=Streptomyces thermoviolaceus subsp. thermoviolaceus TaxID=66860 RepID=A0ABX0YYD6_STRTL|nr:MULTISPECIES: alpha/beta hydrolase [Streptomyces]WTD48284.1 alpha/beta hydrolase [Streptomyces thermoviolaceus]NJP16096.1 alpha/beta hydrolase [Streptomyces thermoviolaceus subsp. thermoviolaceus]RSS03115.1 alpha/beta hydrolase [Streptomyces sp. WAC00469]GGV70388.1 non-heme bromoperoxidase BpoC [Streptomyces thermoviolaceus subsp. apingens]GHA87268.1 non-heme bromoperoxidase BpoC [Streptomyces thermoviolaceus subsp. thermoviolaceus]